MKFRKSEGRLLLTSGKSFQPYLETNKIEKKKKHQQHDSLLSQLCSVVRTHGKLKNGAAIPNYITSNNINTCLDKRLFNSMVAPFLDCRAPVWFRLRELEEIQTKHTDTFWRESAINNHWQLHLGTSVNLACCVAS